MRDTPRDAEGRRTIPHDALPLTPGPDRAPDAFTLDDLQRLLDRPDPLAALAEHPADPAPFIAAVAERFTASGLVLERFDRFRS